MPARRCPICLTNWPRTDAYKVCPSCDERTNPFSNVNAIPADEARSMVLHIEFEKFYEKWDASKPPERLIPGASRESQTGSELATISEPEKPA